MISDHFHKLEHTLVSQKNFHFNSK